MTSCIQDQISFHTRLNYCLEDKIVLDQDGKEQIEYKNRAEILYYNQCFGDKEDLIRQFNEVYKLKKNVSRPVFHIELALAPGEQLSKGRWIEVSLDCARTLEFEHNQFVAILHKDKHYQHIHIIANRIGYDRRLAYGRFSVYKLNVFRRDMENRYNLSYTVNHLDRLSNEQKQKLRKNIRLDKLRQAIRETLKTACDLPAFETEMKKHVRKVFRNEKGIAFLVDPWVVLRGSEAGYPWKKIEAILQQNQQLKQNQEQQLKDLSQRLKQSMLEPNQSKQQPKQQQAPRLRHRISHHF